MTCVTHTGERDGEPRNRLCEMTTKRVPKQALARVGDPYVTDKGERLRPLVGNGKDTKQYELPPVDPKSFRVRRKRTLKDMPAPISVMHGIAAVFMYTVLGIGDREISLCLKCDAEDVKALRNHPGYTELFEGVSKAFIDANSDLIHARIAAYGHAALNSIADIAVNGQKEADKLKASQDIMNRGGHISEQMMKQNAGMSALRILVVDGTKALGVEVNGDQLRGTHGYDHEAGTT